LFSIKKVDWISLNICYCTALPSAMEGGYGHALLLALVAAGGAELSERRFARHKDDGPPGIIDRLSALAAYGILVGNKIETTCV
jgi:hypothetical protein